MDRTLQRVKEVERGRRKQAPHTRDEVRKKLLAVQQDIAQGKYASDVVPRVV
jgi:hypothetical protein